MFSPATRKSHHHPPHLRRRPVGPSTAKGPPRRDEGGGGGASDSSLSTPPPPSSSMIPNRPATGTPAPWSSRLSVVARVPSGKTTEKGSDTDQTRPVYVGEFPQVVRDAQTALMQKPLSGNNILAGGMDKGSCFSWMICGNQLFIWNYLLAPISRCTVLEIPSSALAGEDTTNMQSGHNLWMVCIVRWDSGSTNNDMVIGQCNSAGVVICNQKTQALVYWPDIYSESRNFPMVSIPNPESENIHLSGDGVDCSSGNDLLNSIIASTIPNRSRECIAIACQSSGTLWHFYLTPVGASRARVSQSTHTAGLTTYPQLNKGYARSLIWRLQRVSSEDTSRQFFLLTHHGIQCWNVMLQPDANVTTLWAHEIVGSDGDAGIKKDLAGQKHVWLLDMQVDDCGKEVTILVATFCKDRVSSSSYTQYSLLTMQYKPGQNLEQSGLLNERVLEKKAPLQVIIPKARVEDEGFLFSMRLRIGGRPSGSAIVLSGDGTATVTNYWRGSTRLYQFDLPWDAGRVLDASVFPSGDETEEGAWVVLTEKAGIWAIPEKAVLLGGVEPPERSLSRKGSSSEGAAEEEKRMQAFGSNIIPRRVSSEAWTAGDRQRAVLTGIAQRTIQDEEVETLLGRLFNDFILSGEVEGAFEKLRVKGAFEREGEINAFARMSKSIVDTLAKHWTTTRGADFVASAVVSSLLLDKQQKHQKYLQFLALSKCHEELSSKQSKLADFSSFSCITVICKFDARLGPFEILCWLTYHLT